MLEVPGNTVGLESLRLGFSAKKRGDEVEMCFYGDYSAFNGEDEVGSDSPGRHLAKHALPAIEGMIDKYTGFQQAAS